MFIVGFGSRRGVAALKYRKISGPVFTFNFYLPRRRHGPTSRGFCNVIGFPVCAIKDGRKSIPGISYACNQIDAEEDVKFTMLQDKARHRQFGMLFASGINAAAEKNKRYNCEYTVCSAGIFREFPSYEMNNNENNQKNRIPAFS